jgi:hypothetical protein
MPCHPLSIIAIYKPMFHSCRVSKCHNPRRCFSHDDVIEQYEGTKPGKISTSGYVESTKPHSRLVTSLAGYYSYMLLSLNVAQGRRERLYSCPWYSADTPQWVNLGRSCQMPSCWAQKPSERPSFEDVAWKLKRGPPRGGCRLSRPSLLQPAHVRQIRISDRLVTVCLRKTQIGEQMWRTLGPGVRHKCSPFCVRVDGHEPSGSE